MVHLDRAATWIGEQQRGHHQTTYPRRTGDRHCYCGHLLDYAGIRFISVKRNTKHPSNDSNGSSDPGVRLFVASWEGVVRRKRSHIVSLTSLAVASF
jgi:hypothetical protein